MIDYKAKISSNDASKLSNKRIRNIKKIDDYLYFKTDNSGVNQLISELNNIEYENIYKKRIKHTFKKHLISIIFLFVLVGLLFNQSLSINEIRFINYNTYDQEVELFIKDNLKKVGPFYYLNESISDINFTIKSKFYEYEWISVNRNGSYLDVDIRKQSQEDLTDIDDGKVGDIIASRDALIKLYYVKKGVVFIVESQTVKKGDLLVSGNLKYHLNEVEYIKPQAIIIGEVLEYQYVKVKKNNNRKDRTGKVISKNQLSLFNIKFKSKSPYKEFEVETTDVFNLLHLIKIDRYSYYEVENVMINYNYDDSLTYAKSLIRKEFNQKEHEKIIFIELVSFIEDSEYYEFKFIVKKHENIAKFVPIELE